MKTAAGAEFSVFARIVGRRVSARVCAHAGCFKLPAPFLPHEVWFASHVRMSRLMARRRASRDCFVMIDVALKHVAADLNARLPRAQHDAKQRVIVSNLVDSGGTPPLEIEDMVVLTLTALDEEKNVQDGARGGAANFRLSDPIFLNLHVMFAATHRHYETALAAISAVVGYLKAKPVFDHQNTPRLPDDLRQLNFNMERLGYSELSNIWSYLGAKYLPAAHYTIRMVAVGRRQVEAIQPAIHAVEVGP